MRGAGYVCPECGAAWPSKEAAIQWWREEFSGRGFDFAATEFDSYREGGCCPNPFPTPMTDEELEAAWGMTREYRAARARSHASPSLEELFREEYERVETGGG